MLGTILGDVDGSLYVSLDGSKDGKFEGVFLGDLLRSTYVIVLGSDEGIKLVLSDCKALGTILGNVDEITLGIDVGTDLGYLDGSFY